MRNVEKGFDESVKTRIIGLGNSILTDDGVGIYAAREVGRRLAAAPLSGDVDIVESEVAGFALMELMAGWNRVILIDSIQFDGLDPGTVIRIQPDDLHTGTQASCRGIPGSGAADNQDRICLLKSCCGFESLI